MNPNRRSFLSSVAALIGMPVAVKAAPGAGALAVIPPTIEVPPPEPSSEYPQASAVLDVISRAALELLKENLVFGGIARRGAMGSVMKRGDQINIPIATVRFHTGARLEMSSEQLIDLNRETSAEVALYDTERAMRDPEALRTNLEPACIALAEQMDQEVCATASGNPCYCDPFDHGTAARAMAGVLAARRVLLMTAMPAHLPLAGTGAIGRYVGQDGDLCLRVITWYSPAELSQRVSITALYGATVIHSPRPLHGVTSQAALEPSSTGRCLAWLSRSPARDDPERKHRAREE